MSLSELNFIILGDAILTRDVLKGGVSICDLVFMCQVAEDSEQHSHYELNANEI